MSTQLASNIEGFAHKFLLAVLCKLGIRPKVTMVAHTFMIGDPDSHNCVKNEFNPIPKLSMSTTVAALEDETGKRKKRDFHCTVLFAVVDPEKRLSSRVTVLVMVEDVNDHSPVFQSRGAVTVMEDEPVGFPVIHVIATDADSHEAGRVTYSIVAGNQQGHFMLDATSGEHEAKCRLLLTFNMHS